jgi:hypothetical protein
VVAGSSIAITLCNSFYVVAIDVRQHFEAVTGSEEWRVLTGGWRMAVARSDILFRGEYLEL